MGYRESPAFQRMMQRMGRMRPEQMAVLNALSVDVEFADEETRRTLQALSHRQNVEYSNKSLDLRAQASRSGQAYRGKELDFRAQASASGQAYRSDALDLRTRAGLSELESRNRGLDLRTKTSMDRLGLRRQEFDWKSAAGLDREALRESTFQDTRRQNRTAEFVGLGNVISSYDYGRKRDEIDLETYKMLRALTNKYER